MTTDDTPQRAPAIRPERADVRRNRARLLAAAREMFLRDGADASLEGIARLAGVGIGTLYRHFPTRQDLLEAMLTGAYDDLATRARDLLTADAPGEALMTWLRTFITQITAFRGMPAAVMITLAEGRCALLPSCQAMRAGGEELLIRAQKAGEAPAGADFTDVLQLANAIAMATEDDAAAANRLLALAAAGLRPAGR